MYFTSKRLAEEQKAKDKTADVKKLYDRLKVVGTDISVDEINQARQFAAHTAKDKRGENRGGSNGNF